jgi:ABC-type phosphate/phosphonate transport system permease subunit
MMETVYIAIIGTVVGGILAIPVAVLAARNLTPNRPTWFVDRNFMNILRTCPTCSGPCCSPVPSASARWPVRWR